MTEYSFGIIPLRQEKLFLIQHRSGHWSFPKGKSEPGESPQESAIRELREETGLSVAKFWQTAPFIETYRYGVEKKAKSVTYFLADVEGSVVLQADEVRNGRWVALSEALSLLTFQETKEICKQVINIVGSTCI